VPRVALRDVHKRFGSTQALCGAEVEIEPGEVHALLGENGAGKSTLMRVLYGLVQPDRGSVEIDAARVVLRGPRAALARGIALVHQHFMLVPALRVAENLALGERGFGWLGRGALRERARVLLERYALDLDPDARCEALSVGERQRLEIVRALSRGVSTLILDEPTAVLAPAEIDALLALIAGLRAEGHSVVFISHKLDEVMRVADRVTVLRGGKSVETRRVSQASARELARAMVGAEPPRAGRPQQADPSAPIALALHGLRAPGLVSIDVDVREGEIFAIAGIDGNGQDALEAVLAGVVQRSGGELDVRRPPLVVIPGDRQRTGLVLDLRVDENLILPDAARHAPGPAFRRGVLDVRALPGIVERALAPFELRGARDAPVRGLSGGNQQKICVARALRREPGVLVAVNPTRGLDVTATASVRQALRDTARRGAGVLLVSTDLDEVLELGARIAVMFRGQLLHVEPDRHTRERIGELMLGASAA
jgi:general nucleoside transport system ATP-binding protein